VIDLTPTTLAGARKAGRSRRRAVGEVQPLYGTTGQPRVRAWLDPLWCGVVVMFIAGAGSWIPSKWNDEAATQTAASRSLGQLWQMMHNIDAVHGTYYAFMHFWIIAFGTSNFALRAPSAIVVGVAGAGVVVLARRFGGRRMAICAALVFALLPRVTWMGMEARSSAFTAAVAVWLTIILLRAVGNGTIQRGSRRWWVFYALLGAVAVMLNIYLALLVVAHGVTLVLARRRLPARRRLLGTWFVSAAIAGILSLPITTLTMHQTGQLPFGPLTFTQTANSLLLEQYFTGATPTVARGVPVPPTSLWSVAVIVVAVIGWALIAAPFVTRRFRPKRVPKAVLGFRGVLLPWIVVPVVLVLGYSLLSTPMYTARYFSFTTPAVAIAMGASIAAFGKQWMRITALAVLAVLVLPIYLSQRGPTAKNGTDWQQATAVIQAYAKPGQDIYYGPARPHSAVSMRKISAAYPGVISKLHDITLQKTAIQAANLWGSNYPISHAAPQLETASSLWAVREHPGYPSPKTNTWITYIESFGLHLKRTWYGPETDVLYFAR
jgi:mannosyltransferase